MNTKSALLCFSLVLGLTTMASAQVINEFVANHTSTDTNEYLEVFGSPNTDLSAYTLLHIEGDGSGAGLIDSTFAVGTTDGSGIWWTGFLNNSIENGTIGLMLVQGFSGSTGDDLDSDNDGTLDSMPWTAIADCVGVTDGGGSDFAYCSTVLDSTLPPSGFTVGGASRIPNGSDTDSVSDWMRNDFDGAGIPGFDGTLDTGSGEVLNTPGSTNVVPEPGTMILLGLGALAAMRRSRR